MTWRSFRSNRLDEGEVDQHWTNRIELAKGRLDGIEPLDEPDCGWHGADRLEVDNMVAKPTKGVKRIGLG
ncbi:unnamed protein product [Dovyalis caffra]|uniref:Uncharacterized protein n=1 Tax=Dovyalis caffra TaxID=77055 RepID=A0AAV1SE15_9ROSI|nr:unnamed protein product [Dovyalis caffra]